MSKPATITQTRDLIALFAATVRKVDEAKADDGKISIIEAIGMIGLTPQALAAWRDIDQVAGELADLDGTEADEIIEAVAAVFDRKIEGRDMRRKVDKTLIALHALADAAAEWREVNPPRPDIVP